MHEKLPWCPVQLFNPYGHDNLFTVLQHANDEEWKEVRKAFSKSMSMERIRCVGSEPIMPHMQLLRNVTAEIRKGHYESFGRRSTLSNHKIADTGDIIRDLMS